jgi:hypothetical protein
MKRFASSFVLGVMLMSTTSAPAAEIDGVKLPDAVTVERKTLTLNGFGVRTKTVFRFKVYVAALYLEAPKGRAEDILGAEGIRRLVLRFTHNASKRRIAEEIVGGLEDNTKAPRDALSNRIAALRGALPEARDGEELAITYMPGKGTTLAMAGGREITFRGRDFADAIFSAWLGPEPLDRDLKAHLLGAK